MSNVLDWAAQLLASRQQHERLHANPQSGPPHAEAAYAVQEAVWSELAGAHRPTTRPTAWKVGASSRDSLPLAAPVLPQHLVLGAAQIDQSSFFTLGVEAEIAFRFGTDLPARDTSYSISEIRAAIESAHVAMELVDTRLADAEAAGPFWRLADNLLNGALVIGEPIADWSALEAQGWPALTARVFADETLLAETVGRPPLDDLFHCLPWWSAHIGGVKSGDIVTTGAWNGMHALSLPANVRVEFSGPALGMAKCNAQAGVG